MKLQKQFNKLTSSDRLYQTSVPVIGLSGGIATGKSTVSEILKSEGIPVVCADELVKEIYKLDNTKTFLNTHFPEVISDGQINFSKLREMFFTNQKIKEEIEKLIYSQLPQAWQLAVEKLNRPAFIVYDVPLLFERGLEKFFDLTVLVYAPREVQKIRLMERDDITDELAENILNHQMNIEEKKNKADFVIDNSGSIEELGASLEDFLLQILYP